MAKKPTRARSTSFEIPDLSSVESSVTIPVGDYLLEVVDVEEGEGPAAKYLKWTFEVVEGKQKGNKPKPHITSFAESALFNLKTVLTALEVELPEEAFDLKKEDLVGLQCMGTIEHEDYKGRKQSNIVDFFSVEGVEEKTEPAPKKGDKPAAGKKSTTKKEPEKIAESEVTDMSQEELEDLIKEKELDVDLSEQKTLRKMRAVVIDALTEADLLEA